MKITALSNHKLGILSNYIRIVYMASKTRRYQDVIKSHTIENHVKKVKGKQINTWDRVQSENEKMNKHKTFLTCQFVGKCMRTKRKHPITGQMKQNLLSMLKFFQLRIRSVIIMLIRRLINKKIEIIICQQTTT